LEEEEAWRQARDAFSLLSPFGSHGAKRLTSFLSFLHIWVAWVSREDGRFSEDGGGAKIVFFSILLLKVKVTALLGCAFPREPC
jgi:hypothetical protein